jgi:hypothetical protein
MVIRVSVETVEAVALAGAVVCSGGRGDGVIAFDGDSALKRAQYFVVAGDDLVALLEAAEDFDFSGSGDAGGDGNEADAEAAVVVGEEVDSLD